jgi:hypothetical protein
MKFNSKMLFLLGLLSVVSLSYSAQAFDGEMVWVPSSDGFDAYPVDSIEAREMKVEYHDNPARPRLSGINIDCDDLDVCRLIQENKVSEAIERLPFTASEALNIASIHATPVLVWLIQNNVGGYYTNLILKLIKKPGFDINHAHFIKQETPLQAAVSYQAHPAIVHALLKAGAHPNKGRIHHGKVITPYTTALEMKDVPALTHMERYGGHDKDYQTKLHLLAYTNNLAALKNFLEKSVVDMVNARDAAGQTPLHVAALSSKATPDMIRALLIAGADPRLQEQQGFTSLHKVLEQPNHEKAMLILHNGGLDVINTPDAYGTTPLHKAARSATAETVEALLIAGAKPHLQDIDRLTPFEMAEEAGRADNVAVLEAWIERQKRKRTYKKSLVDPAYDSENTPPSSPKKSRKKKSTAKSPDPYRALKDL